MSRCRTRWFSLSALVTLLLTLVATAAFAQSGGSFVVKSVTPNPFDPSKGQFTSISYTVPATSNYRIAVKNSAGSEVVQLVSYVNVAAGSYLRPWNGKDRYGRVVPNGVYTVVIEGRTISGALLGAGSGTVSVSTGTVTPPPSTQQAFKVTGIAPSPFEPSKGQSTVISYTVPATSNYRIAVKNSAGTEIVQLVNYVGISAGSYMRPWNGKDRNGAVVPNGTYTVIIEGKTTSGAAIATGTGTVAVTTTTVTPPPPPPPATSDAFKVTGIAPSPFDPSAGQSTTATYTVPATSNYRIAVKNSAGTEIVQLVNYVNMSAGTYTRPWNGKDRNGAVVPNGTYTIFVEGKTTSGATIATGAGAVTVNTSTVTPPPTTPPPTTPPPTATTGPLGQMIEGAGRANYDWFKRAGFKFAVTFRAEKTGAITELSVPWRYTSPGYGSGNYGTFTWELQSNGANNLPSGSVITRVTGLKPTARMSSDDAPFIVPISANLVAGQIYHLVIANTDASPSSNWSSINTVMTRVAPWNPATTVGARGLSYNGSSWSPWSSTSNPWNTSGGNNANGSHMALVIRWGDGSITGDPYWSAAMSAPVTISGSSRAGQVIVWNRPTVTISKVGVPVKGSGTLVYHLEKVGAGDLATGPMTGSASGSAASWRYATLPKPVTLERGQTYRLWFQATSGSFSQNPVYGPASPAFWYNVSWGGPQSCVIVGSGGSWTTRPTQDLAFSLE